jgi:hypothetical protein
LGEPDVLVDDYLPDNGQGADQRALGALLRHLHDIQAPDADPVAAEGIPAAGLLPRRIARRRRELAVIVPGLPTRRTRHDCSRYFAPTR